MNVKNLKRIRSLGYLSDELRARILKLAHVYAAAENQHRIQIGNLTSKDKDTIRVRNYHDERADWFLGRSSLIRRILKEQKEKKSR